MRSTSSPRAGRSTPRSVVVYRVFRLAFTSGVPAAGYAAAIAYVLFVAILILTLAQFWLGNRVVHYQA